MYGLPWIKPTMRTQYFLDRDGPFHERSRIPHRRFAPIAFAFQTIHIARTSGLIDVIGCALSTFVHWPREKRVQGLLADYKRGLQQTWKKNQKKSTLNLPGHKMKHSKTDRCPASLTEVQGIRL